MTFSFCSYSQTRREDKYSSRSRPSKAGLNSSRRYASKTMRQKA
jgi:hypothetical protein